MKWLIASDIHGSKLYCEKLFESIGKENADEIILLGDLLYHGPRNALPGEYDPMSVAGMLNSLKDKITCVRGNCDAEVDQMVLEFPITADYAEKTWNGRRFIFTHGHLFESGKLPEFKAGDVVIYGHIHYQVAENKGGVVFINPGSVSIPKNGSEHAYVVFEDGVFTFKDLDGKTFKEYKI